MLCVQRNKPQTTDTGKAIVLGRTVEIRSVQLGENRKLNIYLPEGYHARDTARYPVIYLLDGGTNEDFIHVVGLVQFSTFPWVNRVPKSIVVGIVNVDRERDFTFPLTVQEDKKSFPTSGHSDKFVAFLEKEVQPYMERNYKTTNARTLIGESLGGLLATEILLKKPELFSTYIIVSPSLWWDNGSLLQWEGDSTKAGFALPLRVYIGVGKEGLSPGANPHVMEVDANLLADKLKKPKHPSVQVHFDYLPEENHATIGHHALFNAFKLLGEGRK